MPKEGHFFTITHRNKILRLKFMKYLKKLMLEAGT